jgi:hypothetical protein
LSSVLQNPRQRFKRCTEALENAASIAVEACGLVVVYFSRRTPTKIPNCQANVSEFIDGIPNLHAANHYSVG